jgi:Peptidase family M23
MSELSLEILPACVYVEQGATGQYLNFDLRFNNSTSAAYRLTSIELEVFDHTGARVVRRLLDEQYGLRPPIETIPDRVVPAGGSLRVFNPLHTFAPDVELGTVRCTCELEHHLPVPEGNLPDDWSEMLEHAQRAGAMPAGGVETLVAEASPAEYEQKTKLYLPLTGRVLVAEGHDFLSPHRRIDPEHPLAAGMGMRANSGRYADDYSVAGEDREPAGFGATARSPGAGTVLAAMGDVPDNTPTADGVEMPPPPPDPMAAIFGNYVLIDHESGEFSILGHLQHGSVGVQAGDSVDAKRLIARLGLSGNTDFLHVHYQVQDGPDVRLAEGLPVRFEGLGPLVPGTIVESP